MFVLPLLLLIKLALRFEFEWDAAAPAPLSSASPARMEAAAPAMDGSDGVLVLLALPSSLCLRRFGMVDGLNSGEQ